MMTAHCLFLYACGAANEEADNSIIFDSVDVEGAAVYLNPPDEEVQLDKDQIEELIKLLADVEIEKPDDSYQEYHGQCVQFDICMKDGSTVTMVELNPYNKIFIKRHRLF